MALLPIDMATGRVKVAEFEPAAYYCNGMAYTADGSVLVGAGPAVSYSQGIPLDAGGAVCAMQDDSDEANWQNGIKLIEGSVAMSDAAIINYVNGLPRTALGGLAT